MSSSAVRHEGVGGTTGQRRGAKLLFAGLTVSQICALIRYTFLARLLGPEQLGLAATVILTQQFFESISESGADRFLIQDEHGDTRVVQNLLHSVFAGRGVFTALALVTCAYPLSQLFGAPALVSGMMLLSIAPLLSGLQHLDMRRRQRWSDFSTEGLATLISEIASICVTIVSAVVLHSYIAAVLGVITKAGVISIVAHVKAERPYRFGYSKEHAARLAKFGAPLLLNAVVLYFGSQGDRMIVSKQLGLAELGRYSAVLLLIFYPTGIMVRYLNTLCLPRVSAQRNNAAGLATEVNIVGGVTEILSLAMCAGFAAVGPLAVQLLYGARFSQSPAVIALMGVLLTFRVFRTWPVIVALGLGKTGVVLADNLVRLVGFAAAIGAALIARTLSSVLFGLIIGELFALVVSLVLTNRVMRRSLVAGFDRVVVYVLASGVIYGLAYEAEHPGPLIAVLAMAGGLISAWIWRRDAAMIAATVAAIPAPARLAGLLRRTGLARPAAVVAQAGEGELAAKAFRQEGRAKQ